MNKLPHTLIVPDRKSPHPLSFKVFFDGIQLAWSLRVVLLASVVLLAIPSFLAALLPVAVPSEAVSFAEPAALTFALVLAALVLLALWSGTLIGIGLAKSAGRRALPVAAFRNAARRLIPLVLSEIIKITSQAICVVLISAIFKTAFSVGIEGAVYVAVVLPFALYIFALSLPLKTAIIATDPSWRGFSETLKLTRGRRWAGALFAALLFVFAAGITFAGALFLTVASYPIYLAFSWTTLPAQFFPNAATGFWYVTVMAILTQIEVALFLNLEKSNVGTSLGSAAA